MQWLQDSYQHQWHKKQEHQELAVGEGGTQRRTWKQNVAIYILFNLFKGSYDMFSYIRQMQLAFLQSRL